MPGNGLEQSGEVKGLGQKEAIHVGKQVVEDEEMRAPGLDGLERLGATSMPHDGMGGFTLNKLDDEQANILIIIDFRACE